MISPYTTHRAFPDRYRSWSAGFTLIELLIIVMVMGIMAAIAIPIYAGQVRNYRMTEYFGQVEYLTKYARVVAMEKTTNVDICVSGSLVILRELGTTRPATAAGACSSGTERMRVDLADTGLAASGTSVAIDPRGLAIEPTGGGGVCVSDGRRHKIAIVGMTGVRTQEGSGGCPSIPAM